MKINAVCCDAHRRGFLGGTAALGLLAVGLGATPSGATAASLTKAQRDALTPDAVVKAMLDGNARFLAGTPLARDSLAQMRSSSEGQYPAAVVLSCVDSRAPVEIICDLGLGDTFNARVAGNAVNDDILGSMEFACAVAGAKLVVVMGHTACGAIKGAIDGAVLGNLTLLLARFKSAIAATPHPGTGLRRTRLRGCRCRPPTWLNPWRWCARAARCWQTSRLKKAESGSSARCTTSPRAR